jgi:hypothetical protein
MSNRGRRLRVGIVLFALFALTIALYASHSWGNYHWARTSNPFTLKLGDNMSSTWDGHLATASADWTKSTVLNTTIVPGGTTPRQCKATTGRVEVCNERYGFNGWLGIAQIWVNGSHITKAITKMNDSYFNTSTYNSSAWRQFVVCQEIGHTFGLDHQDEDFDNTNLGSCMDYTNNPGTNQHPNQHDYDQLEAIYAHLDSTTTVGQTVSGPGRGNGAAPPAMDIDLDGPGQWGRQIRGSREQGHSTYVLDFGGGHKVFTFVLWTSERHQP